MLEAEKTKIELNAFASTKEDAARAASTADYEKASALYFSALKDAKRLYGKDSGEEVECLRGLADCYYKLDRFIESKSVYSQVVDLEEKLKIEETEESIGSRFKLAKSHQKLQEFDDSFKHFKRVLVLAEKQYMLGHPLLTNILEAFADMLRRARKEPKLLTELEEKARSSRKKFVDPENASANVAENILNDMELKKAEAERMKPVWAPKKTPVATLFYKTSEQAQKIINFRKEHPRYFISILMAPMTLAFLGLSVSLAIALCEAKGIIPIAANSPAAAGSEYFAPESQESLKFLTKGQVQISRQNGHVTLNCVFAQKGWSEILAIFMLKKPGQAWMVVKEDGDLTESDVLYTKGL